MTVTALMLLLTCCGGNYQAPVTEQGVRQVVTAPVIIDSSTPDSRLIASPSRPAIVVASSAAAAPDASASVVPSSPRRQAQSHRVRSGDTLHSIAFQYDLDFRRLAIANGLHAPYTIFVDQILNLDVNRTANHASTNPVSNIGTVVSNNSVARAQAVGSPSSGLVRQPIAASSNQEPIWQWPHNGRVLREFQAEVNKGIDIGGGYGDPVLAASAGEVVYSGSGIQGTGDLIIIRHSDRYLSAYAHNSVMLVSAGSRVMAGEKIAEVGANASGIVMLHFEIRVDGKSVDPAEFLPRR